MKRKDRYFVSIPPNVKLGMKLWGWKIGLRLSDDWNKTVEGETDEYLRQYMFECSSERSKSIVEFKFVLERADGTIIAWETGENHRKETVGDISVGYPVFDGSDAYPRVAGVAIPVFSLRSESDWGIGEYRDLIGFIEWSARSGLRVVQTLPINETTYGRDIADSYPYNPISVHALNPMYLSVCQMNEGVDIERYMAKGEELNKRKKIAYKEVCSLKWEAFDEIWKNIGRKIVWRADFKKWKKNQTWLSDYCLWCEKRDGGRWESDFYVWIQKACHEQMSAVSRRARELGVLLKGDLPIGVSPLGVEVERHPELFKTQLSAGAPPDYFSERGQNWGFPTYNWDEMKKDGYAWWKERLAAMGAYFDALRIDHILGFFRIWSIARDKRWGLQGYFDKALGYRYEEIRSKGLNRTFEELTTPYVTEAARGERKKNHAESAEDNSEWERSQVLFIQEEKDGEIYLHPRIADDKNAAVEMLSDVEKANYHAMCADYFYVRNDALWREEAIEKLKHLIGMTHMLVCGEDLGMLPMCVPDVMRQLHLLSLEIVTMPKQYGREFDDLSVVPYESVLTTTTHDMAPMRLWWESEGTDNGQSVRYYQEVAGMSGNAPKVYTTEVARNVVERHMKSGAMMVILPLQDYMAMDNGTRTDDAADERINVPDNPKNAWNYRIEENFEKGKEQLGILIKNLVTQAGRQ